MRPVAGSSLTIARPIAPIASPQPTPLRLVGAFSASSTSAIPSSDGANWGEQQQPQGQNLEHAVIFQALRRCRTAFLLVAGLAAWAYLSSGSTGSPFASISITADASTSGTELAAKSAWTGLATGIFHTLCGPDHLAGLAPLSIGRGRMAAAALGALWGFGHSTGQMILGLVFALLKDKFNDFMPALDKWSAYIVPMTLITIGVVGIYENYSNKPHEEEAEEPALALAGGPAQLKTGKRASFTTYFTGLVHGLQPDALYVVIPALALPTKLAAISFIFMFVIGTCVSMGAYTLLIGTTSKALIKEQPWLQSHLSSIACGIAILCGLLMLLAGQGVPVPFF